MGGSVRWCRWLELWEKPVFLDRGAKRRGPRSWSVEGKSQGGDSGEVDPSFHVSCQCHSPASWVYGTDPKQHIRGSVSRAMT